MRLSPQQRWAVLWLVFALLAQSTGILLAVTGLGGVRGRIDDPMELVWIVAPAVALADCGIAHAWIWLLG